MRAFNSAVVMCALGVRAVTTAFANVPMGPPDPILGLSQAFKEDGDANKVNLGAGVYRDDRSQPYILPVVKKATPVYTNMEYAPISGIATFVAKAQKLAFGDNAKVIANKRLASSQVLSGTGALRVAADFLNRFYESKTIYVPNPTWGNHLSVFKDAGLKVEKYTYYCNEKKALDFEKLIADLKNAAEGSVVLLHACAHNPTGMDPTHDQWKQIIDVILQKKLFPFVDMAYQGFASGDLEKDAFALRLIAEKAPSFLLCQSFAKNFGLYGQRTGCLHLACKDGDEAAKVLSQLKILIRPMYSSPPIHGAMIVDNILDSPELTAEWKVELKAMADRMNGVRKQLVAELKKVGSKHDWSHIEKQIGMMAYTGLQKSQVDTLKSKWHIYMTADGRAAISGLNSTNVEYVAKAFHDVTK